MQNNLIKIQMLGGFRISSGGNIVDESSKSAPKFWRMLQYLIAFRHKPISNDELIDAIWPESEKGDPRSSMRNMVHRIRCALISSGIPNAKEMILQSGNGYAWNNSLDCVVDFEEFGKAEKLYDLPCEDKYSKQAKFEKLSQAIDLYKGDFLPNASGEMWAMPIASYCRALFIKYVHIALEQLMERGSYIEAEMICKKTLRIDRFDEKTHEYHLHALSKQEKQAAAHAEYQKMSTLFYEELDANPSESLRAIYLDIQEPYNGDACSLEELTQNWIESDVIPGAYYCEYGVFKIVYQIEARAIARSEKSIYIISIVIQDNPEKKKKGRAIMPLLHDIIQDSLRKGDLFTRAGPRQYVMMLQNLGYEDCKMLAKRILKRHNKKNRSFALKINIRAMLSVK